MTELNERMAMRRDTAPWEARTDGVQKPSGEANLADILERVLDKGIVIAGDIQINLLDVELPTIKLRLLVASADKAKEMGTDWWDQDPTLTWKGQNRIGVNRYLGVRWRRARCAARRRGARRRTRFASSRRTTSWSRVPRGKRTQ